MSWDLIAFHAPQDFKSPRTQDLPEGWEPKPFGLRADVQARLGSLVPGICFSFVKDSLWGVWSGPNCSLEISLGKDENITYVWIAARGDHTVALAKITEILEALTLRGVDLQRGEFFDLEAARTSFQDWRQSVEQFRGKIESKRS